MSDRAPNDTPERPAAKSDSKKPRSGAAPRTGGPVPGGSGVAVAARVADAGVQDADDVLTPAAAPALQDDEIDDETGAEASGDGADPKKGPDEVADGGGDDLAPGTGDDAEGDSSPPEVPAGPISVTLFGQTDVGQIREHNEDNFLIADLSAKLRWSASKTSVHEVGPGGLLMAVCDGMGGAAAGEVASKMATDIIYQRMQSTAGHRSCDLLARDVVAALEEAGTRILREATANRACRGMGTTATVAALVDDHLLLGQVGDSRGYLLRGERLVQVTRDQSLVNQLIEAGQLTEEEAENFEHSNIILQALGTADAVQVDLTFVHLRRGDVLMMCSDGLSGMIRNPEIRETLAKVSDPAEACRVLVDDANKAGGHDNITVIAAVFDGEGLEDATVEDIEGLAYQKYLLPARGLGAAGEAAPGGPYDDTPSIEVTGEFDFDPEMDWDEVFNERPSIPKDEAPDLSRVMVWLLVILSAVVAWYMLFRQH